VIRRWQAGGLLIGVLPPLLLLTACSVATPTTTVAAAVGGQPPATTTTMVATTQTRVDAVAMLLDAIAATGNQYRYSSTVEAGDEVLATIDGIVSGPSFDAVIDAGDVPVEYRRTDDGEWLRQEDGDWSLLDTAAPASEPLASLTAPGSAAVVSDDGTTVVIEAVFDGVDLGVTAQEVTVRITATGGVVRTIEYVATIGDTTISIATEISDVGAVEPVPNP
jgi:hypothetical protein